MVFTENYLHEMPKDIQLLIVDYSKSIYYDIQVVVSINSNEELINYKSHDGINALLIKRKMYVDRSMHKKIMGLKYFHKNVEEHSNEIKDRYKTAFFALKNHIRNIISYLKIEKIHEIFSNNNIFSARDVYKMIYGDRYIIDYDRELLLEIILKMYKTTIKIIAV